MRIHYESHAVGVVWNLVGVFVDFKFAALRRHNRSILQAIAAYLRRSLDALNICYFAVNDFHALITIILNLNIVTVDDKASKIKGLPVYRLLNVD